MAGFRLNDVTGLSALIATSKDKLLKEVDEAMSNAADQIALKARSSAPAQISSGIRADNSKFLYKEVLSDHPRSAYVEFGTGDFAEEYTRKLPNDWDEYAFEFFISGLGKTPAKPFLFPAFEATIPDLIRSVDTILKK